LDLIDSLPDNVENINEAFDRGLQFSCRELEYGGRILLDKSSALNEALSYSRAKVAAFRILGSSNTRLPMSTYRTFFTHIETDPSGLFECRLNEADKVLLIRMAVTASTQISHRGSILALVEWSRRAKDSLPLEVWHLLMNPARLTGSQIRHLIHVLEHLIELRDFSGIGDFISLMKHDNPSLTFLELDNNLTVIRNRFLIDKFPPKDLEETIQSFRAQEVHLEEHEFNSVVDIYKKVESYSDWAKSISSTTFSTTIRSLDRKSSESGGLSVDDQAKLIALARDAIRRALGILPYNTQVLTVIALLRAKTALKGRISQVKTGEGKSTIVAMIAGILGVQKRLVDIISSARPLAVRDLEKYKAYYELLNLDVSHVCTDRPNTTHFDAPILYGTNYDFEFSLLRDGLLNTNLRTNRLSDVAIVDEVDDLLIDQGNMNAIISVPDDDTFQWIVGALHDFMTKSSIVEKDYRPSSQEARAYLHAYQGGRFSQSLHQLSDELLAIWLTSCRRSLYDLKQNKDYVLRIPCISETEDQKGKYQVVIVDRGTGQLKGNSRWEQREHQFLEYKHGLDIQPETKTGAELSHPIFFGGYKLLLGLTGTLGDESERNEISRIYGIDNFDVPPHKLGQRKDLGFIFCDTRHERDKAISSEISDMKLLGRPILILTESIEETYRLSTFLQNEGISSQLFNAVQDEDEAFIVARAGSAGVVTIATNAGGRGTDIILSPESLESGGLHVVFSFYPSNQRIEDQGFGRAARQGQQGSGRMIIDRSNLSEIQGGLSASSSSLLWERNLRAIAEKNYRFKVARQAKITNESMNIFFAHLKDWHICHTELFFCKIKGWLSKLSSSSIYQQRPPSAEGYQRSDALRNHLILLLRSVSAADKQSPHWDSWIAEFRSFLESEKQKNWADFFTREKRLSENLHSGNMEKLHKVRFEAFMVDHKENLKNLELFWQNKILKILEQ
jgi:preprotein translocase subunit SecA